MRGLVLIVEIQQWSRQWNGGLRVSEDVLSGWMKILRSSADSRSSTAAYHCDCGRRRLSPFGNADCVTRFSVVGSPAAHFLSSHYSGVILSGSRRRHRLRNTRHKRCVTSRCEAPDLQLSLLLLLHTSGTAFYPR